MARSLQEHREIYDAIESGNAEAAEEAMRQHVLIQGERFSDFVASMKKFNTRPEPRLADAASKD